MLVVLFVIALLASCRQVGYVPVVTYKTDSVQVPYPVEKELTRWEQLRLDVGGYAMLTVMVIVLIVVGRFIHKLRKGG